MRPYLNQKFLRSPSPYFAAEVVSRLALEIQYVANIAFVHISPDMAFGKA
ncbi:MAG: hypothetical protein ACJ74Z_21745 [Bryobacteraceae bacterium]